MALKREIDRAELKVRRFGARRRHAREQAQRQEAKTRKKVKEARRKGSLAWDFAPLVVLAGAGVALVQEPRKAKGRRLEAGRGRYATAPHEIPKRGWKDILLRTKKEFSDDQVPLVAAGVTFYTLLAIFPGMAAFVSLYGMFADVADAQKHLAFLSFVLPADVLKFIGEQLVRIAAAKTGNLSLAFVAGLLVSLWSAKGAMGALVTGMNIAYEETEKRGFLKKTAVSLGFTLGSLLFAIVAVALLAAGPLIRAYMGPHAETVFSWISWPLLLVGLSLGLALLYRFAPSREPVQWKWISWGSAGVILFWIVASAAFSLYVGNFAHYDKTYGSLGAVIGFMMWIYLSAVVVLAGAELNSEIEHQTTVDTTTGAPQPMGLRRATMADTVGKAQGR
jgi:membrane protein